MHDVEYTRAYALCRAYGSTGRCPHSDCIFSHALLDTARLHALVGDVPSPGLSFPRPTSGSADPPSEKTYLQIEYTRYSVEAGAMDEAAAEATRWRIRLLGGGRATLAVGAGEAETISVQPVYPVKGQGVDACRALCALEGRVFGRSPAPDTTRTDTICKRAAEDVCRNPACRYSHTLFDTRRVEALLDEAVRERGYRDFRPILEIEYVGRPDDSSNSGAGRVRCVWRVTLRCVVSYQSSAPQPVVVTSADLGTAMRLLETQFAASSGKATPTPKSTAQAQASPRRPPSTPRGRSRRRQYDHARQQSTPSSRPTSPSGPIAFPAHPAGPPPSYTDAMGGVPPATPLNPDAKLGRR